MAFTMACPNFKKGLKMAFGLLGVKIGKLNSAYSKIREYSSKFSFSPCKKLLYFKKKFLKILVLFLELFFYADPAPGLQFTYNF
jgi:hypothetical protein